MFYNKNSDIMVKFAVINKRIVIMLRSEIFKTAANELCNPLSSIILPPYSHKTDISNSSRHIQVLFGWSVPICCATN